MDLKWFICLISYKQNGIKDPAFVKVSSTTQQKASLVNRTIIVITMFPSLLLNVMNSSEEENIVHAADKAIKSQFCDSDHLLSKYFVQKKSSSSSSSRQFNKIPLFESNHQSQQNSIDEISVPARFEFTCIIGPIEKQSHAQIIAKCWETKSRGLASRTQYGYQIATTYKYNFSINFSHYNNAIQNTKTSTSSSSSNSKQKKNIKRRRKT